MQFEEILNDGMRRAYQLALTGEQVEELIDRKVGEMLPDASFPGFRPGKVPANIFKASRKNAIRRHVTTELIESETKRHFEDMGHASLGEPELEIDENAGDDNGFKFRIRYELYPSVPDLDFGKDISLVRPVARELGAEVERKLRDLADSQAEFENTKRGYAAVKGDRVICRLVFQRDGTPSESAEPEVMDVIADPDAPETTAEYRCAGAVAGQVFTVPGVPEPADGKEFGEAAEGAVETVINVRSIKRRVPFELNDENAREVGFANLADMRKVFEAEAAEDFRQKSDVILRRRLFDYLDGVLDFDMPPTVWESETEKIYNEITEDSSSRPDDETGSTAGKPETGENQEAGDQPALSDQQDQELPSDPVSEDETAAEENGGRRESDQQRKSKDEARTLAARRLRIGFLLTEVIKRNELKTEFTMRELGGWAEANFVGNLQKGIAAARLRMDRGFRIRAARDLAEKNAVDFILNLVSVSEEEVSIEELRRLVDAD